MDAELWDGSCCRGSDLSIIFPRDVGAQGLLGGGQGSSCPCRGCLEQGTSGWDCRRTALAGIILLIPKHRFGAISRRSGTKQQLPGPKRRTSGFISSSLDPLCTHLPRCFPSSNLVHQAQPAQVGLAAGQLNSFGLHGMKSQPQCTGLFALYFAVKSCIIQGYLLILKYNNKICIFHKYAGQGWARSQACVEKRTFQTLFPYTRRLPLFNEVRQLVGICRISI